MTKTMLIDAANSEEVRVCVLHNGKVEDFDFESATRKPLRGNIYLARVTRVEPSLQAAFVEFGGNRHGFLAFNEIHPDYYQIPVSDRRLIQEAEAEEAAIAAALNMTDHGDDDDGGLEAIDEVLNKEDAAASEARGERDFSEDQDAGAKPETDGESAEATEASDAADADLGGESVEEDALDADEEGDADRPEPVEIVEAGAEAASDDIDVDDDDEETEDDEAQPERARKPIDESLAKLTRGQLIERYKDARRKRARLLRNYKIQEVIKRRQILLVQAVKEERGNKGAALTTYLSLAGRYCVLMPNTARGGGISRKIPVAADRKRLRRIVDGLDVPNGMGLIIRTAGAKRTKAEIKRDYDYLVRLWENIRTLTLKSIAPCLIYEEASLIKRAIRDLYDKDIGAVLVEGDGGYREAKDFMKMLMPSHSKNVQPYKEKTPLFLKYGVESQLDAMYRPTVRLRSGGYIVINQTEALIAIDVNSGKSTRERNIEQTALRTNLEAADEAARQCRLRDLAGLIVIDFIDMEEGRNNRAVEKRLKDALRTDRARIQLGRISGFGLLEMSRQRRRSGIVDGTTHVCPTCGGAGAVRSHEMAALRILRAAENEAISSKAGSLQIRAALDVALYILNHKREWLRRIETDYGVSVELTADPAKAGDNFEIEKAGVREEIEPTAAVVRADTTETIEPDVEPEEETYAEEPAEIEAESGEQAEAGRRKRRRRRRGRRDGAPARAEEGAAPSVSIEEEEAEDGEAEIRAADGQEGGDEERPRKRRRRGRRGGRRGRRPDEAGERGEPHLTAIEDGEQPFNDRGETLWPEADSVEPATADAGLFIEEPAEMAAAPAAVEDRQPAAAEAEPEAIAPATEPEPSIEERPIEPVKPARKGWWNRALGG
ncbi:MAG: Rne/Rng family ribonuclease [Pseudomonadota bacterium]